MGCSIYQRAVCRKGRERGEEVSDDFLCSLSRESLRCDDCNDRKETPVSLDALLVCSCLLLSFI